MNKSIFKAIFKGIFVGAVIFMMPFFILKVVVFFMIAGLLFRMFIGRRMGRRMQQYRLALADNIRNMSDDEYARYKENFGSGCGHHCYHEQTNSKTRTHETKE